MKDMMVDIETLGTSHDAVITQIGACYFDRHSGEIGKEFSVNISIDDCLRHGLKIDSDTLKFWWVRKPTFLSNTVGLGKAINDFNSFSRDAEAVWSHATFDIPIIANACRAIGQKKLPFSYRACRDIRTLVDLSGKKMEKKEKAEDPKSHDGLEDCRYQVKYCVECFNMLRNHA